jgi:signal peptidase I
MVNKWRKYSYTAQLHHRHRIFTIFLWVLGLFVGYTIISSTLIDTVVLDNQTMGPSLHPGDRFIVVPLAFSQIVPPSGDLKKGNLPLKRGALVVIDRSRGDQNRSWFLDQADRLVRFFTGQRYNLGDHDTGPFLKRVIGLPGDEISMTNYTITVKPAKETYALTEFELASRPYEIAVPPPVSLWTDGLPFSGNFSPRVLAKDEYFVLSDERSNTNDSRTWGPLRISSIQGKVVFRYWPLRSFGQP